MLDEVFELLAGYGHEVVEVYNQTVIFYAGPVDGKISLSLDLIKFFLSLPDHDLALVTSEEALQSMMVKAGIECFWGREVKVLFTMLRRRLL